MEIFIKNDANGNLVYVYEWEGVRMGEKEYEQAIFHSIPADSRQFSAGQSGWYQQFRHQNIQLPEYSSRREAVNLNIGA